MLKIDWSPLRSEHGALFSKNKPANARQTAAFSSNKGPRQDPVFGISVKGKAFHATEFEHVALQVASSSHGAKAALHSV